MADDFGEDLVGLGAELAKLTEGQYAAYLGDLTAEEMIVAEAAVTAYEQANADWRATPATMSHHLTRGRFRLWAYWQLLGEKFADAVEGRSIRQIWNMPPRYGKSDMASRWGPVWALDRDPTLRLILVSYGQRLAMENATAVRDLLKEHSDNLRAQLRIDRRRADRFVTTAGGGVLAAGIESGITGFGADGAVFDDPYKNWQQAHSETSRNAVDNAFRSVVTTRLEKATSFVIIPMTRWHESDLCGRLIERMEQGTGEQYEVVRIPDIAEQPDPASHHLILRMADLLGRRPGEPIEPERFTLDAINMRHLAVGSYLAAAMYQQRPAPEEGNDIKRQWFRIEDALPPAFDLAISSWDMKLKDKETGDYVVGQVWGRTGKDLWLRDQLRGQWDQATSENAIALTAVRYPDIRAHYVENTGYGPELMAALRNGHPGYEVSDDIAGQLGMTADERAKVGALRRAGVPKVLPVNPKGDKRVRMRAQTGYIEAGDVHLAPAASWVGMYLDEMAAFPNGAHDDQVDATSQALSKLIGGQATLSQPATLTLPSTPISTRGGGTTRVTAGGSAQGDARIAAGRQTRINPARIIVPHGVPGTGR